MQRLRSNPSSELGFNWSAFGSPFSGGGFGHGGDDSEVEMIVEVSEGDSSDVGRSIGGGGRRRRKFTVERERKERRERNLGRLLIW